MGILYTKSWEPQDCEFKFYVENFFFYLFKLYKIQTLTFFGQESRGCDLKSLITECFYRGNWYKFYAYWSLQCRK